MSAIVEIENKESDWTPLEACIMFAQDDGEGKIASKAAEELKNMAEFIQVMQGAKSVLDDKTQYIDKLLLSIDALVSERDKLREALKKIMGASGTCMECTASLIASEALENTK